MKARLVTLLLLLCTVIGPVERAWAADMNAWLDRTRIGAGETVQLTLEVQGQVSERPDTAPLQQDFEILGLSTGSRVNIVNGRTDARTTWTLTLSPRRSGTLVIPALRAGKHRSDTLQLEVSAAPAPASGSDADILIESDIEPRDPYVQGQVLYTLRLLHAVPVSGGTLSEPGADNMLVQRLGDDREYATTRNGRRYQVIERRYALFPQTSGALALGAPVFDGEIPDQSRQRTSPFKRFFGNDPFFGRDLFDDLVTPTRRVRVRGESAELQVRPRPAAAQGSPWLPAQRLELQGEWQPASAAVRVGEPVTLLLDLEAQGLTGGQLSSLAPETVEGFRVYPDQAQRRTDTGAAGVTGHLQQKIAFLPERSGELALPDIKLRWWDTQADRERVAVLPGRVVRVEPAAGQPAPDSGANVAAANTRNAAVDQAVPATSTAAPVMAERQRPEPAWSGSWPWISAALATGWLLTLLFWWWRVHQSRTGADRAQARTSLPPGTGVARRQFLAACQSGAAEHARRALLAWAQAHWPDDPPRGLEALAQRLPDPAAREALAGLDRALYRGGGQWDGARLAKCLQRLPEQGAAAEKTATVLAPLYPRAVQRRSG